jgi:hypothetical protein
MRDYDFCLRSTSSSKDGYCPINEDTHVEGAMPEPMILQKVLMSVN